MNVVKGIIKKDIKFLVLRVPSTDCIIKINKYMLTPALSKEKTSAEINEKRPVIKI